MVTPLQKSIIEFSEQWLLVRGKPSSGSAGVLIQFPLADLQARQGYGICPATNSRICISCKRDLPIEDYYTKGANRRESRCKCCALKGKAAIYRKKRIATRRRSVIEIGYHEIREINLPSAIRNISSLEGLLRDLILDVILDTRQEVDCG